MLLPQFISCCMQNYKRGVPLKKGDKKARVSVAFPTQKRKDNIQRLPVPAELFSTALYCTDAVTMHYILA